MFSNRSAFARHPNRLSHAKAQRDAARTPYIDLTCGNPTQVGLQGPPEAIAALADARGREYRPAPLGLPEARQAIARLMRGHGPSVEPERVVITASTSEAYAFLFKLLCDPGDELLMPSPSYPLFEHLSRLECARTRRYALDYDGRFHIPPQALEQACTERTRALLAVHPNNPTGSYLKRDELARIAELGRPLISDEVFAPYRLSDDADAVQSAREACGSTLCFSLHGLSKLAALPQLKLSWLCVDGPPALVDEALARLEIIADAHLSVATPVQLALPQILDHIPETGARILARLRHNDAQLRALTQGSGVSARHVEGGWYAVLRLPAVMDDEHWALHLLKRHGVLTQPGYFYDFAGGPHLVVSLISPEDALRQGIGRLLEAVHQLARPG